MEMEIKRATTLVSHNPWHEGEPNNYNHGSFHEDCVEINNKEFNDIHCTWTGTIISEV